MAIKNPQRTQGARRPVPRGDHKLVVLKGPGVFVAAQVVKQGGASDITAVKLDIDGRNIVDATYLAVRNRGLTQANPFGIVLTSPAGLDTLTIGFPEALAYAKDLVLGVTVEEDGVEQIVGNVIHGSA